MDPYPAKLMACAAILTRGWGAGVTVGRRLGRKEGNEKRAMEMNGEVI